MSLNIPSASPQACPSAWLGACTHAIPPKCLTDDNQLLPLPLLLAPLVELKELFKEEKALIFVVIVFIFTV